ncbi:L-rhamnose/proton symporter RhaT [Roseimarinus sediminis]|uniref:L-rhamnose/proton symporter RhaT n=1 Tax=Roseimarinus sediminis TaxID=1610899 RepID=UPI003D1AB20B
MITPNPILGTGLHAIGGMAASACYTPEKNVKQWSWGTFWLVQALFAWILVPLLAGYFTVPGFFKILSQAPSEVVWGAFALGAVYGFGGMSFGLAIKHIGYSLTYTIAIGLSAVIGTLTPLLLNGRLSEYFSQQGSEIIILGMVLSVIGVAICGWAGFKKEKDLKLLANGNKDFKMGIGLFLAIVGGVLSAVFNISLEHGQPIADMAAQNGAGHFEQNAKMIVSTAGCFVTNLIWFVVLGIKQNTLKEFTKRSGLPFNLRIRNFAWSALAGTLWFGQFFFYGLGHVRMGNFQFISWVLHMSMLIFFSYVVGVLMKEWRNVRRDTYIVLIAGLVILIASFVIITWGSVIGNA